jgi:hypothetical protein
MMYHLAREQLTEPQRFDARQVCSQLAAPLRLQSSSYWTASCWYPQTCPEAPAGQQLLLCSFHDCQARLAEDCDQGAQLQLLAGAVRQPVLDVCQLLHQVHSGGVGHHHAEHEPAAAAPSIAIAAE